MATKFLRGLEWNLGTSHAAYMDGAALFKIIYEFWCYCINGGASPTTPGGLAATTPSTLAPDFIGGASLIHSGTDGYTAANTNIFVSATGGFTANDIGRYLVMWKPASGSSEDSIYYIDGYISATQIIIRVKDGGTPAAGDNHPSLTTRSSICYRVFDHKVAFGAAAAATYVVFQMDATGVNSGQTNPQVQFWLRIASSYGGTNPVNIGAILSPGATWNGSAFTDGSSEILADGNTLFGIFKSAKNLNIDGNNTTVLIGDKDFLMMWTGGDSCGAGSGYSCTIHLEIPERVQTSDTNPLIYMVHGYTGTVGSSETTQGYGGGFRIRWDDGVTRKLRGVSKCLYGDYYSVGTALNTAALSSSYYNYSKFYSFRPYLGQIGTTSHYSAIRVRIRKLLMISSTGPSVGMKFGNSGEWIYLREGVLWPWDNTCLPYNMFWRGF